MLISSAPGDLNMAVNDELPGLLQRIGEPLTVDLRLQSPLQNVVDLHGENGVKISFLFQHSQPLETVENGFSFGRRLSHGYCSEHITAGLSVLPEHSLSLPQFPLVAQSVGLNDLYLTSDPFR